ncbi:MAG: ABC transporter permease [Acidobacteriia bacterium]|nr:ABC transporter permease [Methyloceanibacter sp.]MBX5472427.1 ABC transporter permease [Acetobacteraceae bacterium]MCL6490353.1 ABC transporter permease [Terriglobia bacterium]
MQLQRLSGLMRKEFLQILRDPSALGIAFAMPLFLLLLFGYGVSLDAEHVPIAVVVEHPSPLADTLIGGLDQSRYFRPVRFSDIIAARTALKEREVNGIFWLRSDFVRKALDGEGADVSVIVNGVDANTARLVESYLQQVWQIWLLQQQREQASVLTLPIGGELRIWFNPALRSRDYLVPGLIAVIMTLIGALLTALVVAREWERGTMEALMASPVTMAEIIIGKLLPYFVLGMGGMALSVAMAIGLFAVPLHGNLLVLTLASALFLLVALGMGLLISSVAKNQFVAGQIAIVVTFLPAFILSGFVFDIRSMPTIIQFITHLIGARFFVSILQSIFLAGNVWSVILPNAAALGVMAVVFLGLTLRRTRKRLD